MSLMSMIFIFCMCLLSIFSSVDANEKTKYLLYDVNYGEGFNLKRDVFIRIANLVRFLNKNSSWTLVLPPFGRLYHWHSPDINAIPWSAFFDIDKIRLFIPVIEFHDFIQERSAPHIDHVYNLQQLPFESGDWKTDIRIESCVDENHGYKEVTRKNGYSGWFFGYDEVSSRKFTCLSVMADAVSMKDFLLNVTNQNDNTGAVMLDRAEFLIHGLYSEWSAEFWTGRRCLVFAAHLRALGDTFRATFLDSRDLDDRTSLPSNADWRRTPWPEAPALGGPYLGVHLRRGDFAASRGDMVPSLRGAARQIATLAGKNKLEVIFIATDATDDEFSEVKSELSKLNSRLRALRYQPSATVMQSIGPGSLAIIDQWIAAHARVFMGTSQSTFTFRICEEREIMGFPFSTSYHTLCPDDPAAECEKLTHWPMVLEPAFTLPPAPASTSTLLNPPNDEL